ncbi:sensor domain-containing diguanylate cyclase [Oceanobacillus bengalensis]|uniref:Diguanylate cyclase n=1 Tax=Oceanobacillus bengalensis TaxID=1435466 RepID=A0A494Z6H2_9BACI|nr:sensor domain-containing diguanylate cyclase [Oceanobacillus bengalensis]RKQ18159.1 diguanylate cyclase [Oceanobacillus bengalensis]
MNQLSQLSMTKIILDGIQDIVFLIRVEEEFSFYYEFINRAAIDSTILTVKDIEKKITDIYPLETANFLCEQYREVATSLSVLTYKDSYLTPSGVRHYSETTLTPLTNEENKCTHIVAVVKDVTDRKLAELESKKSTERLHESKQKYQSLYKYNLDAIISLNLDGYIENANLAAEKILGYSREELKQRHYCDFVPTDEDIMLVQKNFQLAIRGAAQDFPVKVNDNLGNPIHVVTKFTPIIVDKKVTGIYGIFKDISDHIDLLKKLTESEERFRIIAENAHVLISLINPNGEMTYVSPSYKEILGFDYYEYEGQSLFYNVFPDDVEALKEAMNTSIASGKTCKIQFRQRHKTKDWIWSEMVGTPVFDDENQLEHIVVLTRDITPEKDYETRLKYFALHDTLTGLPNRRLFNIRLSEAVKDFQENGNKLAVLMMDMDNFKQINDTYGHDIGDKVIDAFGRRICKCIDEKDMVARLGGDEFVVLLPNVKSINNAIMVAKKVEILMEQPLKIDDMHIDLKTSIGISYSISNETSTHTILKEADKALYIAKDAGKNTYKIF